MEEKTLISGDLRDYSLPQLLSFLNKNKRTGTLTFTNNDVKKSIYFVNGEIIFATSNMNSDRLCEILLRRGDITPEQYKKASEVFEKTGKRKGIILIELGYLDPGNLFTVIRQQVKEIILSLFEWEEGRFDFKEDIPSVEVVTLDSTVEELINEGIKRTKNREHEDNPFMQKLNEFCERIDTLTYYELLDIKRDATYSEIKKSYLMKVKEYHPDKHTEIKDASLREKLSRVLALLNEAYNTLKDERRRKEYDKFFIKGMRNINHPQNINAREYFNRGIEDYKKGNFWNAADLFQWATRLEPQKATYWAHLSLALSKISRRSKDAEEAMLRAINLEPTNTDYYIHLGRLYLNKGMRLRAKAQFETALRLDPDNSKAQEELEKLELRM